MRTKFRLSSDVSWLKKWQKILNKVYSNLSPLFLKHRSKFNCFNVKSCNLRQCLMFLIYSCQNYRHSVWGTFPRGPRLPLTPTYVSYLMYLQCTTPGFTWNLALCPVYIALMINWWQGSLFVDHFGWKDLLND